MSPASRDGRGDGERPLSLQALSVVGALALAMPSRAAAWHNDGHMTIARIAWKQLNAGEQLRITKVFRAHPHYDVFLADGRPKDLASEAEWVFARAALWADWVRDPMGPGLDTARSKAIKKQFNKPLWHYVDLPFVHPKDVEKFDEPAIRKQILEPALNARGEPRHALAALEHVTKQLRAADTSDGDRAVALGSLPGPTRASNWPKPWCTSTRISS